MPQQQVMSWIIRSNKYPNNPVPVANEEEAKNLIRLYGTVAKGYRSRVTWEYGTYIQGEPDSYRRVGP